VKNLHPNPTDLKYKIRMQADISWFCHIPKP